MNNLLFAGVALGAIAVAGSALAADLPGAPAYYKAPVVVPWSWAGFYIGGNAGYSRGQWDSTNTAGNSNFPSPAGFANTTSPDVKGWVAGVQAGYNWQVSPKWLVGLEGDVQWTGERASDSSSESLSVRGPLTGICDRLGPCTTTITATATNNWSFGIGITPPDSAGRSDAFVSSNGPG